MTAITHRTGTASGQLSRNSKGSVASNFTWSMEYHVWDAMLEAYHRVHPKPSESPNSKKYCRWSGTPGTSCYMHQN